VLTEFGQSCSARSTTEDGLVRPHAERQCEHGHCREAGILQQLAQGELEIIHI
jgi:hypothetical protein